ncbi:MAG: PhoPQ-activated pathogenicity-related family protein [Saprospiraceae bacterium]|nr:PhoPQ-activated pathogenicity-related family protein [Lewinella sp.]
MIKTQLTGPIPAGKHHRLKFFTLSQCVLFVFCSILLSTACRNAPDISNDTPATAIAGHDTPLDKYVHTTDPAFEYHIVDTLPGEGFKTYVVRMVSQRWLTEAEVKDPVWWHWLAITVPDQLKYDKALLLIGGGSRTREQPDKTDEMAAQLALASGSVVAGLHNVPNQPTEFVGDDFGPRVEDELISYGWRKFLEGGAREEDAKWLARLPMTKSAVSALNVVEDLSESLTGKHIDEFVVAGGSKRGWTTWTTAAVDDRVVAIAPIVIDLLNVVPSFQHHWRAYGFWAPAVGDYDREGIMDWTGTPEYDRLLALTEPYSFRDRYDIPKLILNATGDQFFLPDSWQFYWKDLPGEKHLRYVPNSEHSMRETDAVQTLLAFYQDILSDTPRPDFDWEVEDGDIVIHTAMENPPKTINLWQAHNPDARDFRVDIIGRSWTSTEVALREDGTYRLEAPKSDGGYTAFYGELTFANGDGQPLKFTTGVVVTPDTYPFQAFVPKNAKEGEGEMVGK